MIPPCRHQDRARPTEIGTNSNIWPHRVDSQPPSGRTGKGHHHAAASSADIRDVNEATEAVGLSMTEVEEVGIRLQRRVHRTSRGAPQELYTRITGDMRSHGLADPFEKRVRRVVTTGTNEQQIHMLPKSACTDPLRSSDLLLRAPAINISTYEMPISVPSSISLASSPAVRVPFPSTR